MAPKSDLEVQKDFWIIQQLATFLRRRIRDCRELKAGNILHYFCLELMRRIGFNKANRKRSES